MLTDEDLTSELKLAFGDATRDIEPSPGLGATVHRRHRAARRRSAALQVAVPVAALCAGGVAVVAGGSSTSSTPAPHGAASHLTTSGPSGSRSTIATVAYLLTVPSDGGAASFACLNSAAVQVSLGDETWYVAGVHDCKTMVIDSDASLPADAHPIDFPGVPGLYGRTDPETSSRTIYSRNPDGSWSGVTVAADTSDESLSGYYTPSN
jgi:hypothetical protein